MFWLEADMAGTKEAKKSSASGDRQTASSSSSTISSNNTGNTDILCLGVGPQRFMAPWHHLTEFGEATVIILGWFMGLCPLHSVEQSVVLREHLSKGSNTTMILSSFENLKRRFEEKYLRNDPLLIPSYRP
ncbi:hypothetical protein V6N13_023917 [Hibiscus sabdariffa]|uniref:Uncharacterized protein n=2 Tax=Hibiscus sabdariffa TaxID=183260 RepID=A0ABR2PN54_9ROSI